MTLSLPNIFKNMSTFEKASKGLLLTNIMMLQIFLKTHFLSEICAILILAFNYQKISCLKQQSINWFWLSLMLTYKTFSLITIFL